MNGLTVPAQVAGQPDPVGPGAFDTEADQTALGSHVGLAEREQVGVAGRRGWDELLAYPAPKAIEQDSDVLVFVGVDTDEDVVAPKQHAWHRPWVSFTDPLVKAAARAGGQDCDETLVESGSYQVTARPTSGQSVAATTADTSTPRHPQGRS